mmetsp:Transcript_8742/g.32714  ORF Transcript_8742/g.32714 Transcript_8742/m.32714 type:complete len:277 (+) Transcript_8742:1736-2566(+)
MQRPASAPRIAMIGVHVETNSASTSSDERDEDDSFRESAFDATCNRIESNVRFVPPSRCADCDASSTVWPPSASASGTRQKSKSIRVNACAACVANRGFPYVEALFVHFLESSVAYEAASEEKNPRCVSELVGPVRVGVDECASPSSFVVFVVFVVSCVVAAVSFSSPEPPTASSTFGSSKLDDSDSYSDSDAPESDDSPPDSVSTTFLVSCFDALEVPAVPAWLVSHREPATNALGKASGVPGALLASLLLDTDTFFEALLKDDASASGPVVCET